METPVKGHKLNMDGTPGNLAGTKWRCECGAWESSTPAFGPFGRTSAGSRIAQVKMAHGKHVKGALKRLHCDVSASPLKTIA